MRMLLFFVIFISSLFAENSLNLKLSETKATIDLKYNAINYFPKLQTDAFYLKAKYIYTEEDNDDLAEIGVMAQNFIGESPNGKHAYNAGLSMNMVRMKNINDDTFIAYPIGLRFLDLFKTDYFIMPLFIDANFEYAPEILSFAKAERYFSSEISFGAKIIENAQMFVGYRFIRMDYTDNNNQNYDHTAYFGIGFLF